MTKKPTPRKKAEAQGGSAHKHETGRCLHILQRLSAYIDDELASNVCDEIRRHLGTCPNCEVFVESLRHTVALCRHRPIPALSPADRQAMRENILRVARTQTRL
ncbi:MAG TPA: zf-HC2 domain-containing protein [Nitrospiraceae bacterium]|nr:zf-HC2 domain-containing protein [Nitrospiraceae bacterium]